jgi:hypothetical protein
MLGQILSSQSIGSKTSNFLIRINEASYDKTSQTDVSFQIPTENYADAEILTRGICYKISDGTMPFVYDYTVSEDGPFPPGDYSISVTGLATNTTYTFRPYIITIYGIIYGEPVEVVTTDLSEKFYIEFYS